MFVFCSTGLTSQLSRQRKEILQLQNAGISTSAPNALLQRMLDKIDAPCSERDRLNKELPAPTKGKVLAAENGRAELVDEKADNPPWIKALAEVRLMAPREGYCYQHVQAITVAIDQYAEKALGNREYFLNKPYSIGSGKKDHLP